MSFAREGLNAKFRKSREKPQRTKEHEEERARLENAWRDGRLLSSLAGGQLETYMFHGPLGAGKLNGTDTS